MARKEVQILVARSDGGFATINWRRQRNRPLYLTPKEMAAAGYGWQDLQARFAFSEAEGRRLVFGCEVYLKWKARQEAKAS